jgi:uncharacterized protein (TIGR03437 family)
LTIWLSRCRKNAVCKGFFLAIGFSISGFAQNAVSRYALILRDAPLAARFAARADLQSAAATGYRRQIEAGQSAVRSELATRNVRITGSVGTLLNAVFVIAPASRVAEMAAIPGVAGVVPLHKRQALLNRATTLLNGPQAWNLTPGGIGNAGAGIKIGLLDTGIDNNHPAMRDSSLPMPSGFPVCHNAGDVYVNDYVCSAFTNNKVIVARSYVRQLAAGSNPKNPAADSRPDDYTPRDRVGHGTATATSAGGNSATGAVAINGMAPKAYIGNYKIFGSPTVNDGTYDDIMILALEDAMRDGMDIVSMSVGGPAFTGPLDTGAACGQNAGVPCDLAATAFEAAAKMGMTIVIAAGNAGGDGYYYPNFNSISSPGNAPGVIAAGATTNSHTFLGAVEVSGASVPANLNAMLSQPSDAFSPLGAVTAPLVDVSQIGDDGLLCSPPPPHSLTGKFALIQRGTCTFTVKMTLAVNAGAAGVVFYMGTPGPAVSPSGIAGFFQPAVMIELGDGMNLKAFIDANPNYSVTIDPSGVEDAKGLTPDTLASFSSVGPALGTFGMKPDILAVGESVYMAAQSYDPLGELFSANGFITADGTSFATPLTAGAAALVKQNHPSYTGAQIKSVLVNTAAQDVTTDDIGASVNILQTGPGKLAADMAVQANLTFSPVSISFGSLVAGSLPASVPLRIANTGSSSVTLSLVIVETATVSETTLAIDKPSLTLAAGASATVNVTLSGSIPPAGLYSGAISVQGASVSMRVPWMYLVGSGTPFNLQVLSGDQNDGTVGQVIPDGQISLQVTDENGVPIVGTPVSFTPDGGVTLSQISSVTDSYGIAYATATIGSEPGTFFINACVAVACPGRAVDPSGLFWQFIEFARNAPAITAAGVVNAASYSNLIAPGSYVAIFGSGLYDLSLSNNLTSTDTATGSPWPLALDYVMVSFDVPSAHPPVSVPGRMYYVSPGLVVLQMPWELQGQTSAQVKVTIDYSNGNVVTVPIAPYAPAFFGGSTVAATNAAGVIGSSNPALRGQHITLYANGLGPVTNQPASGDPAPLTPLAYTTPAQATVVIGNQPAQVLFSGLTPTAIGLYQIDVLVPAGLTPGNQSVTVSIGGVTSPPSNLPVQ